MTPQFRFTMFNATVSPSGTVVNQPIGWRDAGPSLERDPKYHSLIEYFKGSFIWYGSARDFIIDVEDAEGPEGDVGLTIEIYYNGWETVFTGKVDINQIEDLTKVGTYYKCSAPVIRDDFWTKFISRTESPVDLEATTDMDGNARTAVNKITLPLPCQLITQRFSGQLQDSTIFGAWSHYYTLAAGEFGSIDWPVIYRNEIKGKEFIKLEDLVARPNYMYTIEEDGNYVFDMDVIIASAASLPSSQVNDVEVYIQKNEDTAILFTKTQLGTNPADGRTKFEYAATLPLVKGDQIRFYFENTAGTARNFYWSNNNFSFLNLEVTTSYIDTTTDAYLIKDAAESILSKIVGQNAVVESTMFAGCKRLYAVMRGKHVRGYDFTTKKLFMSFKELWDVIEPCINIGLSYDIVSSVKKIRIEPKEYFYDPVPTVFLNNAVISSRKYDNERIHNKIDVGFADWSKESENGIDDPQTKRTFNVNTFATMGTPKTIVSTGYASSLGIEQARRKRVEESTDHPLDEKIIIIAVKEDGSNYTPELGTDFSAVTNLTNSGTRYNIRLSPSRIFKRWQKFLQGMLEHTLGKFYHFGSSEGNYTMTSQLEVTDCEATNDPEPVLDEAANIAVDETSYNYIPQLFKIVAPMSWETYKTIVAAKNKAIGVVQPDGTYLPYFIKTFDFIHMSGKANIDAWLANRTPVSPGGNYILMEDGNNILDESSNPILLE